VTDTTDIRYPGVKDRGDIGGSIYKKSGYPDGVRIRPEGKNSIGQRRPDQDQSNPPSSSVLDCSVGNVRINDQTKAGSDGSCRWRRVAVRDTVSVCFEIYTKISSDNGFQRIENVEWSQNFQLRRDCSMTFLSILPVILAAPGKSVYVDEFS